MEFLGEFLSTNNSISEDQDTVTKYFYYRPDRYDDPTADLENIFDVRAVSGFPQIGDTLSECSSYIITNIDINKRIDDTEPGVKKVSYIATCTYEKTAGGIFLLEGYFTKKIEAKKDGGAADVRTPPWDLQNTYTRTPVQVEVPFLKGYDSNNNQTKDVVNTAGKRLLCSTSRYRFEYNVKIKERYLVSYYNSLTGCVINDSSWDPSTRGIGPFPEKTCLIFPPTWSWQYWQKPAEGNNPPQNIGYYEYTVKFIYDPQGWDKVLLNIGTWAKFSATSPAEQIYSYRTVGNQIGPLNYTNLAGVIAAGGPSLSGIAYEKVSEPLPLTSGGAVYQLATTDPEHHPYLTCTFQEFPTYNFDTFANL